MILSTAPGCRPSEMLLFWVLWEMIVFCLGSRIVFVPSFCVILRSRSLNVVESWWSPICVQGQRAALSKPCFNMSFSSTQGYFFMFSVLALAFLSICYGLPCTTASLTYKVIRKILPGPEDDRFCPYLANTWAG